LTALQDVDVYQVAVVPFDGDGHVMRVDEQLVIGPGHVLGGHEFVFGHVVGRREQGEEGTQVRTGPFGRGTHADRGTRGSECSSGSGSDRASRTVSTRK